MLAHRGGRRYPLPFLLASLAWPWLHSDGQRQIPTPYLLFARLLSACPQTDSFAKLFCEFAWSVAPVDIRNSQFLVWHYFNFVLHIMFYLRFINFHKIFIPPGLIFTPPRAHRPAAVSHPSRKTDSPPNQDPSMIHSPPALPITNSSRLSFIHREPLFIHSQSNC